MYNSEMTLYRGIKQACKRHKLFKSGHEDDETRRSMEWCTKMKLIRSTEAKTDKALTYIFGGLWGILYVNFFL